jgi:signal peptidase I
MLEKHIKNPILRHMLEWALAVAIALFVFYMVDGFVAKSAKVEGVSMEQSFIHGDRVIVNRFVYLWSEPQFGDVIAFPYAANPSTNYIKRVAGVPGDRIEVFGGFVYRNGERLEGSHLQGQGRAFGGTVSFPLVVDDDSFFVLGDNLPISEDSRFEEVGNVHRSDIIGRVGFRWFPFNRIGRVR